MNKVVRIFVEKKPGFNVEAQLLLKEFQDFLGIKSLTGLRLVHRYDLALREQDLPLIREHLFPETFADAIHYDVLPQEPTDQVLIKEYLPGLFDPKSEAVSQMLKVLLAGENIPLRTAQMLVLSGDLSQGELDRIKSYWLNPLESREASPDKPSTLSEPVPLPKNIAVLEGFIEKTEEELSRLHRELGLAMSQADLRFCQEWFRDREQRNPTVTEIRILDTYWSDHCRHKTFLTPITKTEIEPGLYTQPVETTYRAYLDARKSLNRQAMDICLMDLATVGMRELKQLGHLADLDESDEINAYSINITVERNGTEEEWLLMFKNETHNHPTEIEPNGGAATCLGGAVRDPMSGRSYVYQAMRVTGSGDPREPWTDTLPGKLPQRLITREAASGYSSYGNRLGVPAGQAVEYYDAGFRAKRMELGAVIAAAPKENVIRQKPEPGDVILLVGNKTGRDGCGGAAGSSKATEAVTAPLKGAEVPKGNPTEERKLVRLFRNPAATRLIKKCNDFGAGGVSVAIGELAEGVVINLDAVPTAYPGLDGTELAISESQERMAVVVPPEKAPDFIQLAEREGLSAVAVAGVTPDRRVKMYWKGHLIVDLDREFLDSGGIKEQTAVTVTAPKEENNCLHGVPAHVQEKKADLKEAWLANLRDLNVAGQKTLAYPFDSTVGGNTVLAPFGGKYQATPAEGMVSKIPVLEGETTTGSIMTFGYTPQIARWSPFHGGLYAVVEAVAKNVALGGDHRRIRLSFQEYFEKLEDKPEKWGKPFAALLGAYWAQKNFLIPAIGGKDSMSGSWKDISVPPTLVAFAVNTVNVTKVVSAEFKQPGSHLVLVPAPKNKEGVPDFDRLNKNYSKIHALIQAGRVLAAATVKYGGLAATLSKMAFGNGIGFTVKNIEQEQLFAPDYGAIVLEMPGDVDPETAFGDVPFQLLGTTGAGKMIQVNETVFELEEAYRAWAEPLEEVFGVTRALNDEVPMAKDYPIFNRRRGKRVSSSIGKPRVLIPVFPGTNGEYEAEKAFREAGGLVKTPVIRDRSIAQLSESLQELARELANSQILVLAGGFAGEDGPEGAGKYPATVLSQPMIKEAILQLLERDGLILGTGNGFQALVRTGLLPYGEFRTPGTGGPLLTVNGIGRHISCYVTTKVVSTLSPWFSLHEVGEEHTIPLSCTEGRFVAGEKEMGELFRQGQVATQYVDEQGKPSGAFPYNPTGSFHAVEGITSPDGRILGKMGHPERYSSYVGINIPGNKEQRIFQGGIAYFR